MRNKYINNKKKTRDRVPVRFESSIKNSELILIKVVHESASGHEVKEEVPKYTGREGPEACLQMLKTMDTLIRRYNLYSANAGNTTGVAHSLETLSRALANEPLAAYEREYNSL